jgi:2-iminobutanoate/2-iminopropanoate deaminase
MAARRSTRTNPAGDAHHKWRKSIVRVPGVPDSSAYGFTQCVQAGPLVFVTGQIGIDEEYRLVSNEFGPQARRAFDNLRRCLEAAGSGLGQILSMTVLITDMRHREEFLAIRKEILGAELATSLLAAVLPFGRQGCLIEIQATALAAG